MKSCKDELFLKEYFRAQKLLEGTDCDLRQLFVALGRVFFMEEDRLVEIYRPVDDERVKSIVNQNDCKRYSRIKEYETYRGAAQKNGSSNSEMDEIIRIKSEAILEVGRQFSQVKHEEASRIAAYNGIQFGVNNGMVDVLRISGILRCEGIFFEKNLALGLRELKKAADWNDAVSLLALLHYCGEDREYNLSRLKTCIAASPFAEIIPLAEKFYGIQGNQTVAEVKLLDRLFKGSDLRKEVCNPTYARILYSTAMGIKSKESVLWDQDAARRAQVSSLPLKLESVNGAVFEPITSDRIALAREDEIAKVNDSLANSNLCNRDSYRPLCLVCDSAYVQNAFYKAIESGFNGCNVQKFVVADLNEYDLNPTTGNAFLREIDEDKHNCFMLCFNGDISKGCMNEICGFLRSSARARFNVNSLNVSLNLSSVLLVCISDVENAKELEKYCNVVYLEKVSENEIPNVINDVLSDRKAAYGVEDISVDNDVIDVVGRCDVDEAVRAIDNTILRQCIQNGPVNITAEELKEELNFKAKEKSRIGFGG